MKPVEDKPTFAIGNVEVIGSARPSKLSHNAKLEGKPSYIHLAESVESKEPCMMMKSVYDSKTGERQIRHYRAPSFAQEFHNNLCDAELIKADTSVEQDRIALRFNDASVIEICTLIDGRVGWRVLDEKDGYFLSEE